MEKILNKIIQTYEQNIESIETEIDSILNKAEQGIKITKDLLNKLRDVIILEEFKNSKNEINFFKNVKPQIYSRLIYYVKLFNIESKRPRSSSKSQAKYFNNHIDKLQTYFNDNLEFYHYYRRGATFLDEQYFMRGKADIRLYLDTFHFFTDKQFSTSHDSTVATILAYDLLIIYLKREIDTLENHSTSDALNSRPGNIHWTGKKTDVIELIYALYGSGAINNGTVEIKDIARVVERIFKIDLGNYYHTFVEIKARKINQAKFLDKLKESLLSYIEKSDE